ncbi:MAG: class I SAM-dependent methyltransferase, partial [bacterium]
LNPRPDESELDTIYPPTYYSYVQLENRPGKGAIGQARARFHSQRLRAAFGDLVRSDEPIRVLDVGCGDGRFLDLMKSAFGDEIETHGIDFEEDAIALAAANGHTTKLGRIEDAEYPAEHFHVIYISHVIEHLASPRAFVSLSHRLLAPGGLLHVETPNVDCAEARLAGRTYWGGYHFPRHWHLFTPETLSRLGEECGFEVKSIEFATSPVFLNWTSHHILWNHGFSRGSSELFSVTSIYRNSLWALARILGFAVFERILRMFSRGRGSSLVAQLVKAGSR